MKKLKGAVLILTHSRAELLDELIASIESQVPNQNLPLIVVQQTGSNDVAKVINKWKHKITFLIETDGSANTVADNIGRNRLAGYSTAFDSLGADWVLAVEDDILLATDALNFTEFVMNKFYKDKNFRGINLGSRLPKSDLGKNSYCKTRFGVYGQGAVLPVTSWNRMRKWRILDKCRSGHWDAGMESFMKTGFSIAPNNSRYLDRGWGGTHASSNQNDPYFIDLEESFVGLYASDNNFYFQRDLGYFWRSDLRKYLALENFIFWFKFLITHQHTLNIARKFTGYLKLYR